jgi:hypothetical protein
MRPGAELIRSGWLRENRWALGLVGLDGVEARTVAVRLAPSA